MRYLLAFLLAVSGFAQQPAAPATPETGAAQAPAAAAPAADTASPVPTGGEWFTGSIDLGYRWLTDVSGNNNQFRTLVNMRQRPELFGLEFTIQDPKKRLFDRLDVRGNGWGGEPYNTAHLEARKQGIYRVTADYRNIAYFSAPLSFANPFSPAGINERAFDTRRREATVDLELFPDKHFVPYLSYWHNSGQGQGTQTWVLGPSDEFAVPISLRDSTENYRGGLRVEYRLFHVTLEQGGTTFKEDNSVTYSGSNPGDRTSPLLGQTLALTSLRQAYAIRGDSIYTKVLMTANPTSWINLFGQFLYSQPKSTVGFSDIATGNLADVQSLLFYMTQADLASGTAKQPHVTGNLGFELRPTQRLRIMETWTTDRMHDAASPLVTVSLYNAGLIGSTVNALNYAQVVNYNENEINATYDLLSKLTVRGGWRRVWGNSTVLAGQLSQTGLLVPGELNRNVGLAGLTYRPWQKLTVHMDYENASSDRVYFRTSLNDYNKTRIRARYQATASLSLQARFQVLNNENPSPDIRYSFQSRDNAISIFWSPAAGKRFTISGEYDRSSLRSDIAYLSLPRLNAATERYRDNAHTATSAIDVVLPGYAGMTPKITVGGSLFIGSGSRPTTFFEPLARLSIPLQKHVYWNTEWQYYGYSEAFYQYEGFRTHMFLTGVRLTR